MPLVKARLPNTAPGSSDLAAENLEEISWVEIYTLSTSQ